MALKPEVSLGMGAASAALVYAIYQNALPTMADIRTLPANNSDVNATEKHAFVTSLAIVSAISLIAKDATIFIIGGGAAVAMSWMHRHANAVHPMTGNVSGVPGTYSMPEVAPPTAPSGPVVFGDGSF
ncbi:MAG TPA: hypothetical protein VFK47_20780 [Ktedonobacteraceae bacterium]|nr:hypothetical protein [Ktedonobacteraceae bacterium]